MTHPLLSIQIPTTPDRDKQYALLEEEIRNQCVAMGEEPLEGFEHATLFGGWRSVGIEFMYYRDNKELSIGEKRDRMYRASTAKYSVQWDSDDWICAGGVKLMMDALRQYAPDCVTYRESVMINGEYFPSNFSLEYEDWADGFNLSQYYYQRTPFFKTPILTKLCQEVGVDRSSRYAEDHDFARRIRPLLKTEHHIDKEIYLYRHTSTEHNERYGIR